MSFFIENMIVKMAFFTIYVHVLKHSNFQVSFAPRDGLTKATHVVMQVGLFMNP